MVKGFLSSIHISMRVKKKKKTLFLKRNLMDPFPLNESFKEKNICPLESVSKDSSKLKL